MAAFDKYKNEHIAVYGPDNHLRLTGLHETQSIDKFNYGVANRGASVRVPHSFVNNGYKGYLEDRRPNSQGDPYKSPAASCKRSPRCPLGRLRRRSRLVTKNGRPSLTCEVCASGNPRRQRATRYTRNRNTPAWIERSTPFLFSSGPVAIK